jgi:peptidoglycan/xylan/chitin deacetylase (PgdA/CDA1 family)
MQTSRSADSRGRLLVCFDFEGHYGMPFDAPYDLDRGANLILAELAKYDARAVFFVVGRMVEEHPDVVHAIAAAGHEIGLHGYEHDNLSHYDSEALALLDKNLARVGSLVEDISGTRPRSFRAPYLLFPHFYQRDVYAMLKAQGYRWVSNRKVRYPVELLRPGVFPVAHAWRSPDGAVKMANNRVLLPALNTRLLALDTFGGSPVGRLRWLLGKRAPFFRDGLVEVPAYAPFDCDLLGLPTPEEETPPEDLAYARAVVRAFAATRSELAMITFHDWIVSGGNRLVLLGDALAAAQDDGMVISTVADGTTWLPLVG